MNDWQDLYKNQKNEPELYQALIRYSEHFNEPFPMFTIDGVTAKELNECVKANREYELDSNLDY